MNNDKNSFDDHFRQRLNDHKSPIPDDLFSRLQARRGAALPTDAPLRERLSGHESPVSDVVFEVLVAKRERQKRRRVLLWRTFTGIAALWLLLTFLFDFKNKNTSAQSDKTISNKQNTERSDFKAIDKNTSAHSDKTSNNNPNTEESDFKAINKNTSVNSNKTINNNPNIEGSDFNAINKNTSAHSDKTISNKQNTEGSDFKAINKNTSAHSDKTISNKQNTEGSDFKASNKNTSAHSDKTISNKQNTEASDFKAINKNTSAQSDKIISNKQNTEGSDFKAINKNTSAQSDKIISNKQNTEGSDFKAINKNTNAHSDKTISNKQNTEGSDFKAINKNTSVNSDKTISNKQNTEASDFNAINKNTSTHSDKTISNNQNTVEALNILAIKTLKLPNKKQENPCTDPENGCPTFNGRRRGIHIRTFYVDAFGAPEYVMRTFKTNVVESEKLLAARDSVEKTRYAVSAGARASVVFRNGLAVRAGVIFSQINERAQFDSMGIGSIKTTYDVRILNGKPDTVSITTVVTDGIFRKTRHNHYRSIDIPLQIGYELSLRNNWTFGINGGANINISAWQKAEIVGANLRQQTVSSGINVPNPVFRTQLGVSAFGSLAAYRHLTSRLQLVLEPSVRYSLQPITRTDYALKQQYATAGVLIGLRLKL